MLLPPALQDWLPEDHSARLIVDLIEGLDLSKARINHKGTGSKQYPPSMMLSLLLYSYSGGVFSSRKIEEGTYDNIGMRYITGDYHPDHDTICTFRRENSELVKSVFSQTLQLASEVGIIKIGAIQIASDGTKIASNASDKQNKTLSEIEEEIAHLEKESIEMDQAVLELLEKAEQTDAREARDSSPLPPELRDPSVRADAIKEAKKLIAKKERRKAKLEAARHSFKQSKKQAAEERATLREKVRESDVGHVPKKLNTEPKAKEKVNVHDPESPKLKFKHGYGNGYNAQGSVDIDGSGLLLAAFVTTKANDRQLLETHVKEIEANVGPGRLKSILADTGYDNIYQIDKIEKAGDIDVLCDQQDDPDKTLKEEGSGFKPRGRDRRTLDRRRKHKQKIMQPENRAKMKRRRETIEPTYGIIKEQMGFKRFLLRGKEGADNEWRIVALGFDLRKLNRNPIWIESIKAQ